MKRNFAIFTHVPHFKSGDLYYAYTPYIREMNIWLKFVDKVEIVAPLTSENVITDTAYIHNDFKFSAIPSINFLTFPGVFISIFRIPLILFKIMSAMRKADHLHIRCPGNIGLLACIVQIFFPLKPKTVKYAGNWDPESGQPLSYKIQKWILSNSFLSRNIKVLIYGNWNNLNNNIIPFFTATYSEKEKAQGKKKFENPFKFLFVGSIVDGKRPLLSLKIVHGLIKSGIDARLDIYGKGECEKQLTEYILKNDLQGFVTMHGNQDSVILKEEYMSSHFSILPSKSEGWPKALAEAMFFGCIPIATSVSCVPWMLNGEERGILIEPTLDYAVPKISKFLENPEDLDVMSLRAMEWSQQYNMEKFEVEIQKLL